MADGEKIDLLKAAKSPLTPLYWVKCVMFGLGIGCLFFVGYGVWGYYFKKKPPTQSFEHVEKVVYEANKRGFILFAEPFVAVDTSDKGSIGIRAGCRWEF